MMDREFFTSAEFVVIGALARAVRDGTIRHPVSAQFKVVIDDVERPEYMVDFAVPAIRLGIEIDGVLFHSTAEQRRTDMERDRALEAAGWRVLRFLDEAARERPGVVVEAVVEHQNKAVVPVATGHGGSGQ